MDKITIITEIRLNPALGLYTITRDGSDIGQFWQSKKDPRVWLTNAGDQFTTYGECVEALIRNPEPGKIDIEAWTEQQVF
tara:strand:+ start:1840 stop:2079 length:240 start_codon:yes stop_codon:yes gene_type:complete